MKKFCITIAMALTCMLPAAAQSKLDARSQIAISQYNNAINYPGLVAVEADELPFAIDLRSRAESTATVLIMPADGVTAADIEACGFEVKYTIGSQFLATATISDIEALASSDLVKAMTFGGKAKAYLDIARDAIGVTKIHNGEGLPQAYDGTGVVTGIYDTGCDPNHIAFRGSDSENPRVKRVWHFASDDASFSTYATPADIARFTTDDNTTYHGAHTLGCMAGSFNGRSGKVAEFNGSYTTVRATVRNPFYGTAPGSDIVVGCGPLYDANIIAAVANCIDYAKSVGKPVVVNLSIGSTVGSHDGQDQTALALQELGKEGIICIAAGNEGDIDNTIIARLDADKTKVGTLLLGIEGNSGMTGAFDVWASDNQPLKVTPVIYDTVEKTVFFQYDAPESMDMTYITSSYYSVPEYLHFEEFDRAYNRSSLIMKSGVNGTNNRYNFYLRYNLKYNTNYNKDGHLALGLLIEGKPGQRVDIVNASDYCTISSHGIEGFSDGTPDLSISSMGCSEKLLTIGAYNTRESWGIISGSAYSYNNLPENYLASYSSYGETFDGRRYPLVCSPGSGIVSAISTSYFTNPKGEYKGDEDYCVASYDENGTTYVWDVSQGTSMATPIAAGAIATWLQANPNLTTEDVVNIIKETSDNDRYTAMQSERWGYGKFNAYAGLKKVLELSAVKDVLADNSGNLLINAAGSRAWEVFLAGADKLDVKLFSTSGALVGNVKTKGNSAIVDGANLPAGVYILSVNGVASQRILVK